MSQYSEKGEDLKTKKEVNHKTGSLGEKKLLVPRGKKKKNNSRKYPEVKMKPRSQHTGQQEERPPPRLPRCPPRSAPPAGTAPHTFPTSLHTF